MERRNFLTWIGTASAASIAGCSGSPSDQSTPTETTPTDMISTDTPTKTPTETPTRTPEANFPSYSGTHEISHEDKWWAWEFSVNVEFNIDITVRNRRSDEYGFDVFTFTASEFEVYKSEARGEDVNADAINGASEEGITDEIHIDADLDPGDYVVVVDNTDIGDAGDWGEQHTRRVHVEVETMEDQGV